MSLSQNTDSPNNSELVSLNEAEKNDTLKKITVIKPEFSTEIYEYLKEDETRYISEKGVQTKSGEHIPLFRIIQNDFAVLGQMDISIGNFYAILQDSFTQGDLKGEPILAGEIETLYRAVFGKTSTGMSLSDDLVYTADDLMALQSVLTKMDPRLEAILNENKGIDGKYGYATTKAIRSIALVLKNILIHKVVLNVPEISEKFEETNESEELLPPALTLPEEPIVINEPEKLSYDRFMSAKDLTSKSFKFNSGYPVSNKEEAHIKKMLTFFTKVLPRDIPIELDHHGLVGTPDPNTNAVFTLNDIKENISQAAKNYSFPRNIELYGDTGKSWNDIMEDDNHVSSLTHDFEDILNKPSYENKIIFYTGDGSSEFDWKTQVAKDTGDFDFFKSRGLSPNDYTNDDIVFMREHGKEIIEKMKEKNITIKMILSEDSIEWAMNMRKTLGEGAEEVIQIFTVKDLDHIMPPTTEKEFEKGDSQRSQEVKTKYAEYKKIREEYKESKARMKDLKEKNQNEFVIGTEDHDELLAHNELKERYIETKGEYEILRDKYNADFGEKQTEYFINKVKKYEEVLEGLEGVSDILSHTPPDTNETIQPMLKNQERIISYEVKSQTISEEINQDSIPEIAFIEHVEDFFESKEEGEKPELTDNQMLDLLALQLSTSEDLNAFIQKYFHYEGDIKPEDGSSEYDYHNTAIESLNKIRNGQMVGDCDDWAHFVREIWRRQGYAAQVVGVPMHATCMRVGQKEDGTYTAETIGTYKHDIQESQSLIGAVNKVLEKFADGNFSNMNPAEASEYQIHNQTIEILDIPETGKISIDFNAPLIALTNNKILQEVKIFEVLLKNKSYKEASEKILSFVEKYKTSPSIRPYIDTMIPKVQKYFRVQKELAEENAERVMR